MATPSARFFAVWSTSGLVLPRAHASASNAGIGGAIPNPCPYSQFKSCSTLDCSLFSIPSATIRSRNISLSWATSRTILRSSSLIRIFFVNPLSIFSTSIGSWRRYVKGEKPVPKSSSANFIPSFLHRMMTLVAVRILVSAADSVISIVSEPRGRIL